MSLLDYAVTFKDEHSEPIVNIGIFPRGHVTILAGEPGVGKTWVVLSIARGVADGTHGLGLPDNASYEQNRVIIFAGETGVKLLNERMKLLGGIKHAENVAILSTHLLFMNGVDVSLNSTKGLENIQEALEQFRPAIVFFDTVISFIGDGKDESNQADMTEIVRNLSLIASKTNCAIVLVHHFRKRQQRAISAERDQNEIIGSSAFIRLASVIVSLEKKGTVRFCRCLKSWWREFTPFSFDIKNTPKGVKISDNYDYDIDGAHSLASALERACDFIRQNFADVDEFTTAQVLSKTTIGERNIREALRMLRQSGDIVAEQTSAHGIVYKFITANDNTDDN